MIRAGVLAVVAGALAVLLVHVFVAEVRAVDSDSMTPALEPGERILVAKAGLPAMGPAARDPGRVRRRGPVGAARRPAGHGVRQAGRSASAGTGSPAAPRRAS